MTVSLPPLIKPCMPFSSTRLSKFQVTGSPLHMRLGFLPRGVDWDFIEAIVSVQPFSAKEALFAPALAVFLPQPPLDAAMDFEPRSRHDPSAVAKAEVFAPAPQHPIGLGDDGFRPTSVGILVEEFSYPLAQGHPARLSRFDMHVGFPLAGISPKLKRNPRN